MHVIYLSTWAIFPFSLYIIIILSSKNRFSTDCCLILLISASKRIMGAAGVPLVPGYHGVEQDIDLMKLEADKIGYPILIKPTHGGGGKVNFLIFI